MPNLHFSLGDYQAGLVAGQYTPTEALCPYYGVDPVLFDQQAHSGQRRDKLPDALRELQARTGQAYFRKTYTLQAKTLDYSARCFPAYRFILPEVMSEDWLAIVDWGKFQRDHVLHQPLCGYVVLKLLDDDGVNGPLLLPDGESILDTCVTHILQWKETWFIRDFLLECGMPSDDPLLKADNRIARQVWRTFFREVAYVAAVFHDLGYPWQYAERIQGNLSGMNSTAVSKNRSASQVVDQFGHRLLLHALRGYKKRDAASPSRWAEEIIKLIDTTLSNTHGFPGALGFLHLNDSVRSYPTSAQSPLHLLCVEWAAVAIMMHDMGKIYWGKGNDHIPKNGALRLSFSRDPLSAIVTLADVLQEFERPTAAFNPTHHDCTVGSVAIKYDTACLATELTLNGGNLTINYRMRDANARAIKRKAIVEDERIYFDPRYGFLNMQSIGIDNVRLEVSV